MRLLMGYSWPGNVRELKSAFEYTFVTCQDTMIQPYDLPPSIYNEKKIHDKVSESPVDQKGMKKHQLIEALKESNGNQSKAADLLGISRVTVWNRMKKYNVRFKQGQIDY